MNIVYYQLFFLAGLFLYDYYSKGVRQPVIKNKKLYFVVLLAIYAILNLIATQKNENITDLFAILYSFVIFDFILLQKIKPLGILFKLGNISYTLYLNHLSVLLVFYALITLSTGQLIFFDRIYYYTGIILAVALSILFYKLIEKPSLILLEKQKHRKLSV